MDACFSLSSPSWYMILVHKALLPRTPHQKGRTNMSWWWKPLQLQDQGLRKHKEAGTLGVKVFTEAAWCLLRGKKIWEVEYKQISLPSNIHKDIS